MDETGITNVQRPRTIVATKGARHVANVTSGERGATVTDVCAINTAGGYLPPMFIFPRKRMVTALMNGAPPESVGYCSPNGWIDADLFVKRLEHFAPSTNACKENQQIIIMDGHHSHKTLAAITFARSKGIQLLVLPPHCTHRMQPLDTTFFKSLKTAYNNAVDSWMVTNPGRRMSFYDMAGVFNKAFNKSASLDKAVTGFRVCGMWPYDPDVFTDDDFAAAMLTEEPTSLENPHAHQATAGPSSDGVPTAGPLPDGSPTADPSCDRHPNAGPSSDELPSADPSCDDHATTDMPADETAASLPTFGCVASTPATTVIRDRIRNISPLPKTSSARSKSRKQESAAWVSSSPYKNALTKKGETSKRQGKGGGKPKGKRPMPKKKQVTITVHAKRFRSDLSSDEDEEWHCLICGEPFSNSRSCEVWVQCVLCRDWAHRQCTEGMQIIFARTTAATSGSAWLGS